MRHDPVYGTDDELYYLPHRRQRPARIEPQHLRQLKKLHHVDPSLAALEPSYERLILAEPVGELCLRHAGGFAALDQERDQRLVASGYECFCHVNLPVSSCPALCRASTSCR